MLQFKEREGHCNLPKGFKIDGFSLASWVFVQRRRKETLSALQRQRLDDLGFVWDPLAEAWEEGFTKLLQFKEVEGHCRVPSRFKIDGYGLGAWVASQRKGKDSLSTERFQRLDDVGFVWDVSKGKPNDQ